MYKPLSLSGGHLTWEKETSWSIYKENYVDVSTKKNVFNYE